MEQPPPLERLTASVAALRHLVDVPIPSLVYLEVVDVSHNIEGESSSNILSLFMV